MGRIVALIALPLLLITEMAQASFSRADLDRLALDVWRVRAAFHTLTVMQGAPEYVDLLDNMIADTEEVLDLLEDSVESDAEEQFISDVRALWDGYRELAMSNTVAEMGYTDRYTIEDLESGALKLYRLINGMRTDTSGRGEDLADLAVLLQRLTSEYMFISASADGGGAIGTGAEEGRVDFIKEVPAFDSKLQAARNTWKDDSAINRELRSVNAKWNFIRESLLKFYENAVPFLVHRYSEQMVDSLTRAADSVAQGS